VIIEQVSGMKHEDYLHRNIFEPLQMTATGYDWGTAILKGRASGYSKGEGGEDVIAHFLDMGQRYTACSLFDCFGFVQAGSGLLPDEGFERTIPCGRFHTAPVRLGRRNQVRLWLGDRAGARPQSRRTRRRNQRFQHGHLAGH
jgi:CubicO group peptidase (beta-lactamase class C family)